MSHPPAILDVREDIRNGREPFSKIMGAVAKLGSGENLLLIAPFEPVPLFHVLAKQGFTHAARETAGGDWEVLFKRENVAANVTETASPVSGCGCGCAETGSSAVIELDARGLEPPQPLVTILEALASLPDGVELRAQTDRRPLHLDAQLEERGFTSQTEETESGSFVTHIRRD